MPRNISIDGVQVMQVQLVKDASGAFSVYVQYNLKSGNQLVQPMYREVTSRLSAGRKAAATAVFDGLVQDIAAIESV